MNVVCCNSSDCLIGVVIGRCKETQGCFSRHNLNVELSWHKLPRHYISHGTIEAHCNEASILDGLQLGQASRRLLIRPSFGTRAAMTGTWTAGQQFRWDVAHLLQFGPQGLADLASPARLALGLTLLLLLSPVRQGYPRGTEAYVAPKAPITAAAAYEAILTLRSCTDACDAAGAFLLPRNRLNGNTGSFFRR